MSKKTKERLCSICNQLSTRPTVKQYDDNGDEYNEEEKDRPYKPIPLGNYQPKYNETKQKK